MKQFICEITKLGYNKYNLGSGGVTPEGWLNITLLDNLTINTFYNVNQTKQNFLLNYDLRNGIPALDNSLDVVYHSHLIEHLLASEAASFIKECYRVLKRGGLLRILVPDLRLFANAYINNDKHFLENYRKLALENNLEVYSTPSQIFLGMMHGHEHKWAYDFESLYKLLVDSGFINIGKTLFQSSKIIDICAVEPYSPLRAMESLCIECNKN